jgi:hypothetical protein
MTDAVVIQCDCHLQAALSRYRHKQNISKLLVRKVMWMPTQDEAIDMYARFLKSRHGKAASRHARKRAHQLLSNGDSAGHAIWNRVADVAERLPKKGNVESVMALW